MCIGGSSPHPPCLLACHLNPLGPQVLHTHHLLACPPTPPRANTPPYLPTCSKTGSTGAGCSDPHPNIPL
jgi:hypothetical protein